MELKHILALLVLVSPASSFYNYRTRIPNGDIVPHPCKANYMWRGVGHENPDGAGIRNLFGKDFANAGRKWTKELCGFDSDGDGESNGEELGDPDCEWTEGSVPKRVTDITHPGICTPFGKGDCSGRDSFVDCEIESFGESCDVIKKSEVVSMEMRFTDHEIPNTETNYYCQYFDLPSGKDLHIVADEGLIDNHDVVHHILLYGCPDTYKGSPTDNSPNPCSMSGDGESCSTIMSLWTVGLSGTCFGEDVGFRIGLNGFKKVKMEIHYNNPMLVSGHHDKSGIRIYYKPAIPGVQDLSTFTVGQSMLEIPPGKERVEFKGDCPSSCSSGLMRKPIYVISTFNHMHYMGRRQRTVVRRNGQEIKVLADDEQYNYDSPVQHKQEEPFEIRPGDEISTTCTYSSMSKKRTVFYGEGTNDEMCFSFLTIYPADALPFGGWCSQIGPLSPCDMYAGTPRLGCDWRNFVNLSNPNMAQHYIDLEQDCSLDGTCREECKETGDKIKQSPCISNPSMNKLVTRFMKRYEEGARFLGRLHSCTGRDGHDKDNSMDCQKDCGHICHGDNYEPPAGTASLLAPQIPALLITIFLAMAAAIF